MSDPSRNRSASSAASRQLPSYLDLIADEQRRRGGGGGGAGKRPSDVRINALSQKLGGAATAVSRAGGNNAVVVKVLSYGSGAASARNVLAYQSKEEKARDQDGIEVYDINAVLRQWEREFGNRQGSKDVLRLTYELEETDRQRVADALATLAREGFRGAGDVDRTYAFSVSEGVKGQTRLQFALVIAHEKVDRSDRGSQNRIPAELDDIRAIDARIDSALRSNGIRPMSRYPAEFASGPKVLAATLHAMQRGGAEVTLSTRAQIEERPGKSGRYRQGPDRREITTKDHKELTAEGKIVGALLQTRQPRDFMHLLLSGPANVDREKFVMAGRDFLREQFAGHRFAYAVHNRNDPQKHPHIHVMVALRNCSGRMLNPNIRDFTEWRLRFADKARDRGLQIDRQKRIERAGPPPIKRWEWEMFQRMGATAPSNVVAKVIAKIRDEPTSPRLASAQERFESTRGSVQRVIAMLEGISKDRTAPSTARDLSADLSIGLRREYDRLEMAVRGGRDPATEKGENHMLRSTPITGAQAKAAKETLASTAIGIAAKIANPSDRLIFEQAAKIIGKVVGLQLDARVTKNRDRSQDEKDTKRSGSLDTKSAAGRDLVSENGFVNKISNNRTTDVERIARSNAHHNEEREERSIPEREKTREPGREMQKSVKLRAPQVKDRDRNR